MIGVLDTWMALMTEYRSAHLARATFRDRSKPQKDRDEATVAYGRHCDTIITLLDELAEQLLLTKIGMFLTQQRGR